MSRSRHARHRARLTTRGKVALGGVALLASIALAAGLLLALRGPHLIIPSDPCASPPPLEHWHGVTLQPEAMTAFQRATSLAGQPIDVRQSYRSCAQQILACERICGNANGCPGTCAKPGTSYHQLGAAVDVTEAALATPAVVHALETAGWCESVPQDDPGHFSFGGCH